MDRLVIGTKRYSSWSMRGWLVVRLAGLAVEEVVVPLAGGSTEAIKAISPSGLVPYLEHDGHRIWDSLAIAEYCAERKPGLWPADSVARGHARAISAEMHSGFRALRLALPMNLGRARPRAGGLDADVQADVARIVAVWAETRRRFGTGGPFLFGAAFTIADAMYAPVVARLLSYQVALPEDAQAYCAAVHAHPLVAEWYGDAIMEPGTWLLEKYESIA